MKTKTQKQEELKTGKELLEKSKALIFADLAQVKTSDLLRLRRDLKKIGANLFVLKKRLAGLLFKEGGVDFDLKQFKTSIGTIFSTVDVEALSGPVFKFFASLEVPEGKEKDIWAKHILGGYNTTDRLQIDPAQIIFIGKLPSREALLGQLLGMIAAPIRSFLYILDQRSKSLSK